ncbi:MAG: hypothetical protein QM800_03880 [Paludibacter sp.]
MTDEDFALLTNGKTRATGDMFVFDNKVIKKKYSLHKRLYSLA